MAKIKETAQARGVNATAFVVQALRAGIAPPSGAHTAASLPRDVADLLREECEATGRSEADVLASALRRGLAGIPEEAGQLAEYAGRPAYRLSADLQGLIEREAKEQDRPTERVVAGLVRFGLDSWRAGIRVDKEGNATLGEARF